MSANNDGAAQGGHGQGGQGRGGRGGGRGRGRNQNYNPRPYVPKQRYKIKHRTGHNGLPFNGPTEECHLCCQPSDVFGVGTCRHPACMECCIRMRCLGNQKRCHACREDIPMMYFVRKPPDWESYHPPACRIPHNDCSIHQICFEDEYVAKCYDNYNLCVCPVCVRNNEFAEFPTFPALKHHLANAHNLSFCHLCIDNLHVLPKDQHIYNSNELRQHMTGERNLVEGVRGHPDCKICHQRFFDDEELYKHARKEHFFCQICSQNEGTNTFFGRKEQLYKHYRQKHHPCPHPECEGVVFSNEFDLNVHQTQNHGGKDRTIPIEFQFSRAQNNYGETSSRLANRVQSNATSTSAPSSNPPARYGEPPPRPGTQAHGVSVVPPSGPAAPFPPPPGLIIPSAQATGENVSLVRSRRPNLINSADDFPSLAPAEPAPNAYRQPSDWRAQVVTARNKAQKKPQAPPLGQQINSANYFPSLGEGPSTSVKSATAPKTSVWGKGNAAEVIKKPPPPKKPPSPQPPRRRIIPLPEVWPENMRRKLEARELGLPEPEDIDPPLPQPPLDIKDLKKKHKAPKKKTKTVSWEALKQRLSEQQPAAQGASSSSKFSVLSSTD